MSIIRRLSVVMVNLEITWKSDKLSVSMKIGIGLLTISSMSFLIANVMSKAWAKAIVSLPRTDVETLLDLCDDQYNGWHLFSLSANNKMYPI